MLEPSRVTPRNHELVFSCSAGALGDIVVSLAGVGIIIPAGSSSSAANALLGVHPILTIYPNQTASLSVDADVCTGNVVVLSVVGIGPLESTELSIDGAGLTSGSITLDSGSGVQGRANTRPETVRIQCAGTASAGDILVIEFTGKQAAGIDATAGTLADLSAMLASVGVSAAAITVGGGGQTSLVCPGAGAATSDEVILVVSKPSGNLPLPVVRTESVTGGPTSLVVSASESLSGISGAWGSF